MNMARGSPEHESCSFNSNTVRICACHSLLVRATEDADLIFERSPASEATLLQALESIHAGWISDERDRTPCAQGFRIWPLRGWETTIPGLCRVWPLRGWDAEDAGRMPMTAAESAGKMRPRE
jgi:hypothetical protein